MVYVDSEHRPPDPKKKIITLPYLCDPDELRKAVDKAIEEGYAIIMIDSFPKGMRDDQV